MKWIAVLVFVIFIILLPFLQGNGDGIKPWELLNYTLPAGQWYYLLSKLAAQYAYILLCLQVLVGMIRTYVRAPFHGMTLRLHRNLGMLTVSITLLHIGLFIIASTIRSGHFPMALLTLQFDQGYYAFYVSLGLIAAFLLLAITSIALLRKRLPYTVFEYGHRFAWLVWLIAFLHSVAIGSESGGNSLWAMFYALSAGLIIALGVLRFNNLISEWCKRNPLIQSRFD